MIRDLLIYSQKADEIMILAYADFGFTVKEANTLFSHILSAQHIWACRILEEKPSLTVWAEIDPLDFVLVSAQNYEKLFKIVDTLSYDLTINYSNSNGEKFSNTVYDILIHLCNHSTYHRGQLANQLRRAGGKPPVTDYIMLKRDNLI